jgi:hypothetical protein
MSALRVGPDSGEFGRAPCLNHPQIRSCRPKKNFEADSETIGDLLPEFSLRATSALPAAHNPVRSSQKFGQLLLRFSLFNSAPSDARAECLRQSYRITFWRYFLLNNYRTNSQQNLSEWRHGGYAEWQARREFLENVQEKAHAAADLEESAALMADLAAGLLAIRFADTLTNWNGDPNDPAFAGLKHLSALVRDIAILSRRAERSTRLRMEQHAFSAACHSRGTSTPEDTRFASSPYARRWSRRFGPPDPPSETEQYTPEILSGLRALMHGYYHPDPVAPSQPPPESPDAHSGESNKIRPSQTTGEHLDEKNAAPRSESPAEDAPTPPSSATKTPISDAELWQMRNRPLPGEPEPAWRTQLRTQKTIPPWESAENRWGESERSEYPRRQPRHPTADSTSPQTPRSAILARAGS